MSLFCLAEPPFVETEDINPQQKVGQAMGYYANQDRFGFVEQPIIEQGADESGDIPGVGQGKEPSYAQTRRPGKFSQLYSLEISAHQQTATEIVPLSPTITVSSILSPPLFH